MAFSSDIPLQSNQLSKSIDFPASDSKDFVDILTLDRKRIVDALNTKEGGLHILQETASFQQYFSLSPTNLQNNRNGYRVDFDLVALNLSVPIPIGVTTLTLTTMTQPPLINGILYPVHGYGGATIAGPMYVFLNDPQVYIRFNNTNPAAQTVIITNNSGSVLTQCYWTMEYLKN
jgi:hypothetical protein